MIPLGPGATSAQVLLEPGYYVWVMGPSCRVDFSDGKGRTLSFSYSAPAAFAVQHLSRFPVPVWAAWLTITNTTLQAGNYDVEQRAPLE